jgi:hypothetical protein
MYIYVGLLYISKCIICASCYVSRFSYLENIFQTTTDMVGCGMRLYPFGTSATIWPIVPAPDDGWWWVWSNRWNDWQGKLKYSEKTCPSAALSTTNPTCLDLSSNQGRRGGKPTTNRLSYSTANCHVPFVYIQNRQTCLSVLYLMMLSLTRTTTSRTGL